jgi:hypothetical protein
MRLKVKIIDVRLDDTLINDNTSFAITLPIVEATAKNELSVDFLCEPRSSNRAYFRSRGKRRVWWLQIGNEMI